MEIKTNVNMKTAPGFNLINKEILKIIPRKNIFKVINFINASFGVNYEPKLRKVAEVIMIPSQVNLPMKLHRTEPFLCYLLSLTSVKNCL